MLAKIWSAAVSGIDGFIVHVEVDLSPGLPVFATVGLPDAAVRESKDRVVAAVRNSGFDFPVRRVTVNLSPADVKKRGPLSICRLRWVFWPRKGWSPPTN